MLCFFSDTKEKSLIFLTLTNLLQNLCMNEHHRGWWKILNINGSIYIQHMIGYKEKLRPISVHVICFVKASVRQIPRSGNRPE